MLRLWPDEIQIGLFSDHCWLRRAGILYEHAGDMPDSAPGLLEALASMLDDPAHGLRPGSVVSLTVSDTLAAVTAMPWQDGISKPGELKRYAEVIFEKNGVDIGRDWAMRAEFTSYGSLGLAYALPGIWMNAVVQMMHDRSLRLKRVLPASAAAFYMPIRRSAGGGRRLFLLQEARRISALVFDAGGLIDFDVEPVTAAREEALLRLLRRSLVGHGAPASVMHWSTLPEGAPPIGDLLSSELRDAKLFSITREALR